MTFDQWQLILTLLRRPCDSLFGKPRWRLTEEEMDAIRALVTLYQQERR